MLRDHSFSRDRYLSKKKKRKNRFNWNDWRAFPIERPREKREDRYERTSSLSARENFSLSRGCPLRCPSLPFPFFSSDWHARILGARLIYRVNTLTTRPSSRARARARELHLAVALAPVYGDSRRNSDRARLSSSRVPLHRRDGKIGVCPAIGDRRLTDVECKYASQWVRVARGAATKLLSRSGANQTWLEVRAPPPPRNQRPPTTTPSPSPSKTAPTGGWQNLSRLTSRPSRESARSRRRNARFLIDRLVRICTDDLTWGNLYRQFYLFHWRFIKKNLSRRGLLHVELKSWDRWIV